MKEVKEPRIETTTRYYYEKERTLRFGIPELKTFSRDKTEPLLLSSFRLGTLPRLNRLTVKIENERLCLEEV